MPESFNSLTSLGDSLSPQQWVGKRRHGLKGFNDHRYPESAIPEQLARRSFMTPLILIADELEVFLKKVFNRSELMRLTKDRELLFDKIYDLYNDTEDRSLKLEASAVMYDAYNGWQKIMREIPGPCLSRAYYQVAGSYLYEIDPTVFVMTPYSPLAFDLARDFMVFPLNDSVVTQCRVYLNLTYHSRIRLIHILSHSEFKYRKEIRDAKIVGPNSNRNDTAVIYCRDKTVAEKIAVLIARCISEGYLKSANQTVPAMTKRISAGVAISIGADPKNYGTKYVSPDGKGRSKISSFGTIRSQAITMAILCYREAIPTTGSDYAMFKQLVAIGFREFGLDPADPAK